MTALRRILAGLGLFAVTATLAGAQEPAGEANRPWFTLTVARLDRLLEHADGLLLAIDRPELSEILAERYRGWRDFTGLDQTRPLGLMWAWRTDDPETEGREAHDELIYLPVTSPRELMQTVTWGAVPFREVTPTQFVIERPEIPYHAIVIGDVLWMGDSPTQIRRFGQRGKGLTSELAKAGDLAMAWDLKQVPVSVREDWARDWRAQREPALQRGDDESEAAHRWRTLGARWVIEFVAEALTEWDRVTVALKLDPVKRRAELEVQCIYPVERLPPASLLRWTAQRSPLSQLLTEGPSSSGLIQVPWFSRPVSREGAGQRERFEVGWQIWGDPYEQRTSVVAIRLPAFAAAVAPALAPTNDSRRIGGTTFHRVLTPALPTELRRFVGWDPEVWVGQLEGVIWAGFGPPEVAAEYLAKALAAVAKPATNNQKPANAEFHLSARDIAPLTELFEQTLLFEPLQPQNDQLRVRIEPHAAGLTLRVECGAGLLRLMGTALASDLAAELERMIAP